ncbi:hypothetical protein [Streptomyces noursei]|uniref:hypothetical protein n=1 Tax=Streptomyces noursei TaxID=1971 RepID=UPI0008305D9D
MAVHLWLRRSLRRALALRLAVVAHPHAEGRLRHLPRAIQRRLYARTARVSRDRACALTRLARLSQAVGVTDPPQL